MRCAAALSTELESAAAIAQALERLGSQLEGQPADFAVAFASSQHAETLGELARELTSRGLAAHVIGCTGEFIVGEDREVEEEPALSVWAVAGTGAVVQPLRFTGAPEAAALEPLAQSGPAPAQIVLLGDPFSFEADPWLKGLRESCPGVPVLGGMASAAQRPGRNRLVLDADAFSDGAVGLRLEGLGGLESLVSQGCRPIGQSMVVTKAERNLIRELGGRPALPRFQEMFAELEDADQDLVRQGLHLGRVINEYQDRFGRGDFLVRNVLGIDETGALAINDLIRVGQTVQFHVRDAASADEDLRELLAAVADPGSVRGALLFTCNGRGSRLFSQLHHDIRAIHEAFGPIPVAGFFAMGELGPVGGQNFVHGFTASIALFREPGAA